MRLIDADAFERAVMFSDDEDLQDVIYRLRDFPTIEPEQKQDKWILCSEKLPKDSKIVFVYLFGNSPYLAWRDDGEWRTEDFTVDKDEEPVAWLPLPEPYRED